MQDGHFVRRKIICDINALKAKIVYNMDIVNEEEQKIYWKKILDELILFKQIFLLVKIPNELISREEIFRLFKEKSYTIIESYNVTMGIKEANGTIIKNLFEKITDIIMTGSSTKEEVCISDFVY